MISFFSGKAKLPSCLNFDKRDLSPPLRTSFDRRRMTTSSASSTSSSSSSSSSIKKAISSWATAPGPLTEAECELKVSQLRQALGPLADLEEKFCKEDCLRRYLRARNWHVRKAEKMLRGTLLWRAEYEPERIRWKEVEKGSETGKMYRSKMVDKQGRPILVMRPANQNSTDDVNNIKLLVWSLENAIYSLPAGQEQMVWLIDFNKLTQKSSSPLKTQLEVLSILQNHYPERLAMAVLYNPPKLFHTVWKMISPFIDPKTYKKVKFINPKSLDCVREMRQMFNMHELEAAFGGFSNEVYNHEEYSARMLEDEAAMAKFWGIEHDQEKDSTDSRRSSGEPMFWKSRQRTTPSDGAAPSGTSTPLAKMWEKQEETDSEIDTGLDTGNDTSPDRASLPDPNNEDTTMRHSSFNEGEWPAHMEDPPKQADESQLPREGTMGDSPGTHENTKGKDSPVDDKHVTHSSAIAGRMNAEDGVQKDKDTKDDKDDKEVVKEIECDTYHL